MKKITIIDKKVAAVGIIFVLVLLAGVIIVSQQQSSSYIPTYHPQPQWQIFEDFTLHNYETGGHIGKYEFYLPDSIQWTLSWQHITGIDPFFSATLQRGNELPPFDLIYEQGLEGERIYTSGPSEKYTLSLHSEGTWAIIIWIYL